MAYLAFLYFSDLTLVLRARAVTNPFPDLPNFTFDSLNKMETTSSGSKVELGISGKGLATALALKTKARSKNYKKARYSIGNFSTKDLSNIIKYFEKNVKVTYVKRIPKHEPTSSYYHLVGCIAECMLRFVEDNQHVHGGYAEETAPSSNVNVTDKEESK